MKDITMVEVGMREEEREVEGEREGESEEEGVGEWEDREARKGGKRRESLTRYSNFATTILSSLM